MAIRSIGIISKPRKAELQQIIPVLLDWLSQRGIRAFGDSETLASIDPAVGASLQLPELPRNEIAARSDLILVLGGDGTLLAAARNIQDRDIPILAVNLGDLGFLTAVTIEELYSSLQMVIDGKHQLDCRKLLKVDVMRSGEAAATYHALNDAV